MKHNTHIYIVKKAIQFMRESVHSLQYNDTLVVNDDIRKQIGMQVETLYKLLNHYKDSIKETTWAPNDALSDRSWFHKYKLSTDNEFCNCENYEIEIHTKDNRKYYHVIGGGELPYKVDQLASTVSDLKKLRITEAKNRLYKDNISMRDIIDMLYQLSHYVIDAHVPMHCDIRADKPTGNDVKKGKYYNPNWHNNLESLWDRACTYVGISEGIIEKESTGNGLCKSNYTESITFDIDINANEINAILIPKNELKEFIINICIISKERSNELFPTEDPDNLCWDKFSDCSRRIFADSIGNLISVWVSIWVEELVN